MKLIPLLCLAFGLSVSNISNAQIQVGISSSNSKGVTRISEAEISKFKKSTTYFVLRAHDYARQSVFEAAITKVWTVTPFKIIRPEEMDTLDKHTSSFFYFGSMITKQQGKNNTTSYYPHFSYDLYMFSKNKNGAESKKTLGKFLLNMDAESYLKIRTYAMKNDKGLVENKIISYLFKDAYIENWAPNMIACYLKCINDGLENGKYRSLFDAYTNQTALNKLRTTALWVPNYVVYPYKSFANDEKDTVKDESNPDSVYNFPLRFRSIGEIEQISTFNFFYLSYVRSGTNKFISVFDGITKEMIYTAYTPKGYSFKYKDLKRIAAKVK